MQIFFSLNSLQPVYSLKRCRNATFPGYCDCFCSPSKQGHPKVVNCMNATNRRPFSHQQASPKLCALLMMTHKSQFTPHLIPILSFWIELLRTTFCSLHGLISFSRCSTPKETLASAITNTISIVKKCSNEHEAPSRKRKSE